MKDSAALQTGIVSLRLWSGVGRKYLVLCEEELIQVSMSKRETAAHEQ